MHFLAYHCFTVLSTPYAYAWLDSKIGAWGVTPPIVGGKKETVLWCMSFMLLSVILFKFRTVLPKYKKIKELLI